MTPKDAPSLVVLTAQSCGEGIGDGPAVGVALSQCS